MICFMNLIVITMTIIPTKAAIKPTNPVTNKISSGRIFTISLIEFSMSVGIELLELELELET